MRFTGQFIQGVTKPSKHGSYHWRVIAPWETRSDMRNLIWFSSEPVILTINVLITEWVMWARPTTWKWVRFRQKEEKRRCIYTSSLKTGNFSVIIFKDFSGSYINIVNPSNIINIYISEYLVHTKGYFMSFYTLCIYFHKAFLLHWSRS